MARLHVPAFVLAPAGELPLEPASWQALLELQGRSVTAAERIRLFRLPDGWQGSLEALTPSGISAMRPFCDALVPGFAVDALSLGVYELMGTPAGIGSSSGAGGGEEPSTALQVEAIRCLDQVPLLDVQNEACWFYPTEDGAYLSSCSQRTVRFRPGYLPDRPPTRDPLDYQRARLRLLWSLMADDAEMTCVGLTYNHRRIDWPLQSEDPHPTSHWAWFTVDTTAERPYSEIQSRRVVLRTESPPLS
ncbi:MAG: hypothetical protein AB1Z21_02110 [Synechococcaceae cyanobacterium]